ncbi:hypothetical protein BDV26DRAFT_256067 [Aspergillus bertholletiae]|uniref:Uncharacterized protein n=1 Tax=Aspergillus bertholletiae TaxID=1226010 RepID=A0A5N7BH25_9EURO|nr:hypothetical protein BDV26DRAFT_256067 [Aspergillus bertholletiae]
MEHVFSLARVFGLLCYFFCLPVPCTLLTLWPIIETKFGFVLVCVSVVPCQSSSCMRFSWLADYEFTNNWQSLKIPQEESHSSRGLCTLPFHHQPINSR